MQKIYLRAWLSPYDGISHIWEPSTKRRYLRERVVFGGLQRGNRRVFVYVARQNMDEPLTKHELQSIACCHLDGTYNTHEVNLGEW